MYDRLRDPDAEGAAEVYRDLGSIFRGKIQELVKVADTKRGASPEAPGSFTKRYSEANEVYQTLSDLEALAEKRLREESGEGPFFKTAQFKEQVEPGISTPQAANLVYPETSKPAYRFTQSLTIPGEGGSRLGPRIGNAIANAVYYPSEAVRRGSGVISRALSSGRYSSPITKVS